MNYMYLHYRQYDHNHQSLPRSKNLHQPFIYNIITLEVGTYLREVSNLQNHHDETKVDRYTILYAFYGHEFTPPAWAISTEHFLTGDDALLTIRPRSGTWVATVLSLFLHVLSTSVIYVRYHAITEPCDACFLHHLVNAMGGKVQQSDAVIMRPSTVKLCR